MKYRIIEKQYFDSRGVGKDKYYYIKIKKSFLGIIYYIYYTEEICDLTGKYRSRVSFNTIEGAESFIKNVLCPGKPADKLVTTVCKEVGCPQ